MVRRKMTISDHKLIKIVIEIKKRLGIQRKRREFPRSDERK